MQDTRLFPVPYSKNQTDQAVSQFTLSKLKKLKTSFVCLQVGMHCFECLTFVLFNFNI